MSSHGTLIPFMRNLPTSPNHLPKTPHLLIPSRWGFGFQPYEWILEGHIQFITGTYFQEYFPKLLNYEANHFTGKAREQRVNWFLTPLPAWKSWASIYLPSLLKQGLLWYCFTPCICHTHSTKYCSLSINMTAHQMFINNSFPLYGCTKWIYKINKSPILNI